MLMSTALRAKLGGGAHYLLVGATLRAYLFARECSPTGWPPAGSQLVDSPFAPRREEGEREPTRLDKAGAQIRHTAECFRFPNSRPADSNPVKAVC